MGLTFNTLTYQGSKWSLRHQMSWRRVVVPRHQIFGHQIFGHQMLGHWIALAQDVSLGHCYSQGTKLDIPLEVWLNAC